MVKATTRVRQAAAEDAAAALIPLVRQMRQAGMAEAEIAAAIKEAMAPGLALLPKDAAEEIFTLALEIADRETRGLGRVQAYVRPA